MKTKLIFLMLILSAVAMQLDAQECINTVLDFDGVDDNILLEGVGTESDFTVGLWFKAGEENGGFEDRFFGFGANPRLEIGINTDGLLWRFDQAAGQGTYQNVRDGQWHHVAIVAENVKRRVYLDFELIDEYISSQPVYGPNLRIGTWSPGVTDPTTLYTGQIDEFRGYDIPIAGDDLCNIMSDPSANNPNLRIYFDFEEGKAEGNNSIISSAVNKGDLKDGVLSGFKLEGTKSNYVCGVELGCFDSSACTEECNSQSVDLSTGVDFNTGNVLPVGEYEGGWQMISGPDTGLDYPLPGFVLQPNGAWDNLAGAAYISPFANTNNNDQFPIPYLFERKFCVCETSEITLSVEALVDNFIDIGLYDEFGNEIQNLISYTGPSSVISFNLPAFASNTNHILSPGIYSLRAGLRNDGGISMGMAIKASVKGAGLIASGCCSPFTIITGTVFSDAHCDGAENFAVDFPIPDATVILCDSEGAEIARSRTDEFGYYSFSDIGPGNYLVKQLGGSELSAGNGGYQITLGANTVEGGLNFGNCPPEQCTEECPADAVDLSTGIDFNTGSLLPVGAYEGGWQMISGPDAGLDYPLPGFVLQPNSAWDNLAGAAYISPFANTDNNEQFAIPYLFERKFCICETSEISLEVEALVDNFIDIGLYDESGTEIQNLINYPGPSSAISFNLPAFSSITNHVLAPGVYSLRAGLRNDGGVSMGMAIKATLKGGGLIQSVCCSPFTIITGTVFNDAACDGVNNFGLDDPIPSVTVTLCNSDGGEVASTTTDEFGYYSFTDVGSGNYLVKQSPLTGSNMTLGKGGYEFTLGVNTVEGGLDFGNCPPEECDAECPTETVDLSTGVDFNTGSLLPVGEYEGGWQMISGPDAGLNYPLPGFVLNPDGAWADLPGAAYISPFANTSNNEQYDEPYMFERKFCVCVDSEVSINIEALVDNFIEIGLYDASGTEIQNLISYDGPAVSSTFNLPGFMSNTTHSLSEGCYSLRAGLRNDGGVSMGMAINASISGGAFIESACCSPFTIITGTVFNDSECDGKNDFGADTPISGVTVTLCNSDGGAIASATTDEFGYYSFNDVGPGSYTVKQESIIGQDLSLGAGGYNVDLGANTVEGGLDFGNCPPEMCMEECPTDSIDLSTGVDFNTGALLPIGEYEGGWQMISGPDAGLNYPLPGFVLNPDGAWDNIPGAAYISPFANTSNNQQFDVPYLFERKFCVCIESEVLLNIDALVDNFIDIGLYDDAGVEIQNLVNYSGPSSSTTFNLPAFTSNTTHVLQPGMYSIRAGLRNDGGVSMGMAIKASIIGGGLIESKCCSPFTVITGTVFMDAACNSINDFGTDAPIAGATVVLCNSEATQIASTTTDEFGYYSFRDILPGNYTVKQLPLNDLDISLGAGGHALTLGPNSVEGGLDFGNCVFECCGTEEELTASVSSNVTVSSMVCTDEQELTLEVEGLLECQYVSRVFWGDGELVELSPGQSVPGHTYSANGVYLLTVDVTSELGNGEECQTDQVNLPFLFKDCNVSTNFPNPEEFRMLTYPIPTRDLLNVELSSNPIGYSASIINMNGVTVGTFNVPSNALMAEYNTSALPAGVYGLVLISGNGVRLENRFIVVK